MRSAVALSMDTTIALPNKAPAEEVPHDVLRHGFQPVVAGDQVVLPPQLPFQLGFLLGSSSASSIRR
jgi:hypothetical protein